MATYTYKPKASQADLTSLSDSLANLRLYNVAKDANATLTIACTATSSASYRGIVFAAAANSTGCAVGMLAISKSSANYNQINTASAIAADTSTAGTLKLTSTRATTYIVLIEGTYITVS